MQDDLLGYLLGALDSEEMARVEAAVNSCAETRQQLEMLRRGVRFFESGVCEEVPVPDGLSMRTCHRVRQLGRPPGHATG